MIHPVDAEIIRNLLRVNEVPSDIEEEYEIRVRMFHSGGGSGPLRILALIDLLRHLGRTKPEDPKPVAVDWRNKVGAEIVAKYGDKDFYGTLKGIVDGGRLVCELDGVDTEVELPRYLVTLAESGEKKSVKGAKK
jgi:hypothetical protein